MDRAMIASTEEIISASYFYDHPSKIGVRLICPSCLEPVHVTPYLGDKYHYFKHEVRNEFTPDCDQRVNGISDGEIIKNYRMKVTTPLYLYDYDGCFSIVAKFKEISDIYKNLDFTLTISGMSGKRYRIARFVGQKNEVKLDFIPIGGSCVIKINGYNADKIDELRKIWGRAIDSFSDSGAFFNCSTHRIIKKGWNLIKGSSYYLVTKSKSNEIPLFNTKMGVIEDVDCSVYLVDIPNNPDRGIEAYISFFGLHLIDDVSSAEMVWPPVVKSFSDYCPLIKDTDLILNVNGLYESDVWTDGMGDYVEKRGLCTCRARDVSSINIMTRGVISSLDLINNLEDPSIEYPNIYVMDKNDENCEFGLESVKVVTNFTGSLVKHKINGLYEIEDLCENGNNITGSISLTIFSGYLRQLGFVFYKPNNIKDLTFNRKMLYDQKISIPMWFREAVLKLGKENNNIARLIMESAYNGMISKSVFDYLERWK